jgi:hypothetical protein
MCHARTTPVSSTTIVPRPTELGQWNGDAVDPATWLPLQLQVTTMPRNPCVLVMEMEKGFFRLAAW